MTDKVCTKCLISKSLDNFHKQRLGKNGLSPTCKDCKKVYLKNRYKEKGTQIRAAQALYRAKNKVEISKRLAKYRLNNREKRKDTVHRSYLKHKGTKLASVRKYQEAKKNRVPKWLTSEHIAQMKAFYANRPEGFHVDHIIPLHGKEVSGLHVPWNLQYLPALENQYKSNKLSH